MWCAARACSAHSRCTYSRDAGLRKAANILHILGEVKPGEIENRAAAWEDARAKLYASAQAVLGSKSDQELLQMDKVA